ncbi:hypothetical protein [Acrocarpospora catenulata]|uniref:hypothetical protein n=1 Tax=Acrocarpospora catenulata TaxID=2836182 RepID=UPI001BDB55B7|nr:hypothetical protein [Acrocarpospora catenulata]
MKRFIAGLVVCAAVLVAPAAPASAAVDPGKALKARFVAGTGVKVSTTLKTTLLGEPWVTAREVGTVAFARNGVVASDFKDKMQFGPIINQLPEESAEQLKALQGSGRIITIGKLTYLSGARYAELLPEGKEWIRLNSGAAGAGRQLISSFEPRTLTALVKSASSVRGGVVRGSVSSTALAKISPSFKGLFGAGKGPDGKAFKVAYTLWLDNRGLVKRITSTVTWKIGASALVMSSDSRLSGWGGKVKITAPPSKLVVDAKDLDGEVPDAGPVPIPL